MGNESSKESLVFFKLTKEGFSGFIKLSFEEFKIHGIFITADRSALLVLKRHQAATFLKNFRVHFVLYSQEKLRVCEYFIFNVFIHFEIGLSARM